MHILLQSFLLGISYGLGPCLLSCAPVLVPLIVSTSKDWKQGFLNAVIFSFARIIVYVFLGFMMGLLGRLLQINVPNWLIGLFMVALGIAVIFKVQNKCMIRNMKVTGRHMAFATGIVMGFSPCAPMLAALALAVATKSAVTGAMVSLTFGIGTLVSPILLLGLVSGRWAQIKEFKGINNHVAGGFLILIGILWMLQ